MFTVKKLILTTLFLGWSAAMLSLGSIINLDVVAQSHASQTAAPDPMRYRVTDLNNDHLAGENLGEFEPYYPELGDLVARGVDTFWTADEVFSVGIWESKPGKMSFDMEYDELMYIVDGSVTMTDTVGNSKTYTKGQAFIAPKGWSGSFEVGPEGLRKIWAVYIPGE